MTTILVIEDNPNLASLLCDRLISVGFTTVKASTGGAGLQLAKRHCPELIVCDVELSDMDGYQVIKDLRSHPATTHIPVIILAEHAAEKAHVPFRNSMEHGADDHFNKPVNLDSLIKAVQVQIEKRQQLTACLIADKTAPTAGTTSVNREQLEQEFQNLKLAPWSNLWVIRICNHGMVQERYGHVFGKLVLQDIREKLYRWQEQWHDPDLCIARVAHWRADKFVVFWKALSKPISNPLDAVLPELQKELQQSLVLNNHQLLPEIEISTISDAEINLFSTLKTTLTKSPSSVGSLPLAERLRRAIQRNELELYFQPQVDLDSGQIIGAEALVRWTIPGKTPMLPANFIPIAEENGLMLPLGEWTLATALTQLSHWQTQQLSGISLAVNISSYQLRSAQFIERLMAMVNAARVSPIMMDLELPEQLLIDDLNRGKWLLTELQSRGFSTVIDDFGCGSLSHLQYLPVNILKLDKCFVRDLNLNYSNQIIVKAIMEMARGLNISTIAMGVETARELSVLKQLKCQCMQGYLFSPALPAQDFETLLLESAKKSPDARALREHSLQKLAN